MAEDKMKKPVLTTGLVPLDGSPLAEEAIPYARALLPDGGQIVLLRVLPEVEPLLGELAWTLDSTPEDFTGPDVDAARAALDAKVTSVDDPHHRWETQVALGDPSEQILQTVEQRQIDIVVMTTHGRGAIGRVIFGSVADRVSSASPVPVLLVRPHAGGQEPPSSPLVQRLVVPLDGSELAEGALPLAVALARQQEIAISLVRAVDHASLLASLSDGTGLAFVPPGEVYQEMIESITSAARDYLASVAARVEKEGVKVTWAVWEGSPYVAITDATERGDLIVLTSHGRGGALRWLMGSVAEKLVREASVPVLLVPSINRGSSGSVSENR